MQRDQGIIFIGGTDRGFECLNLLMKHGERILHIFCLEEDSHEKIKYSIQIRDLAKKGGVPFTLTKTVKNKESIENIKKLHPDLIIVMGWRTIIPKEILEIPRRKVVAVHESLLPKYRGFAPINWVIINGETKTGVTLFFLDDGIDTGDIIDQLVIPINKNESASDLYQKTKQASIDILIKNLKYLKTGDVRTRKQDGRKATYGCARIPKDGMINWNWDSLRIYNTIRALSDPYPGAFSYYRDKKIIIQQAKIPTEKINFVGRIPGRVVKLNKSSVYISTGDGILEILQIETNNGVKIKADEYFTSLKETLGYDYTTRGIYE